MAWVLMAARASVTVLLNIFCFSLVIIISLTFALINQTRLSGPEKMMDYFIKARKVTLKAHRPGKFYEG